MSVPVMCVIITCSTEVKHVHQSYDFSATCGPLVSDAYHSVIVAIKQDLFSGPVVAPCINCTQRQHITLSK